MGFLRSLAKTAAEYYAEIEHYAYNDISIKRNESIPVDLSRKNDFTGTEYNRDEHEKIWYQPIKGLGLWDRVGTAEKYKSYAYAAINKRAMSVAKADCYIYKEFKHKKTEVDNHPFEKLLKSENVYGQNGKQLLYLTSAALDLFPDVYWHVQKTNSVFGTIVTEIRFLLSRYVQPIMNKENTLIEYYRYGNFNIPKEDVIHFKRPNPYDNICGTAPADKFNFTLEIEYLQGRTSKNMFNNNANLEGIIMFPDAVDPDNKQVVKDQFKAEYTGDKTNGTLFLDNGAKYEATQASPRELDYMKSRLAIRDEIFVILDVPKTVMNVSDDVNYSNSQAALRSFIENNIQPFCEVVIESKINSYFRKIYGEKFLFKMEWDFKTDRQMQLNTYDLYLRHKVIKKTVIAEEEGYSPEDVPEETQPILEPNKIEDEELADKE